MGRITVDGAEFNIKRMSQEKYSPTYVLLITLQNINHVDIPRYERERILDCGSRSQLTDTLIKEELERFLDQYPEAEIKGFGVTEQFPAREADRDTQLNDHNE